MDARRALFERLIDYAGLFPPAELGMRDALANYRACMRGRWAAMCGRFIVPASRVLELSREAGAGEPMPLSVVIDAAPNPATWLTQTGQLLQTLAALRSLGGELHIEALEVLLPPLAAARDTFDAAIGQFGMLAQNAGLRDLPIYVELPRSAHRAGAAAAAMPAILRAGMRAKIRCGGTTPEAFPSSAEIATFIGSAHAESLPFKATAGLHHPVRALDARSGLDMHGFLNVLCAALFVRTGATQAELVRILDDRDAHAFDLAPARCCWRERCASAIEVHAMRAQGFLSYGSCSFEEPVADLISLGMLAGGGIPA